MGVSARGGLRRGWPGPADSGLARRPARHRCSRSRTPFLAVSLQAKDPNAPKRPLSSYMLFCQEKREEVKSKNKDAKATEVRGSVGSSRAGAAAGDERRPSTGARRYGMWSPLCADLQDPRRDVEQGL